jgi:bifunctional UDP-N-acetylglucosamine pyrophosphorylase/glucosamine-1-phosphate N-acetyltransferase
MRSALPKVLHEVAGRSLIQHVVAACEGAGAERIVAVLAPNQTEVQAAVAPHAHVVQFEALGTGHAARMAQAALVGFDGEVMILFGDTPLVRPAALRLLREEKAKTGAAVVVCGFQPDDPAQNGRLVRAKDGSLAEIVEWSEASEEQRAIRLCNGGLMLFDAAKLWILLGELTCTNAKGEYFLTDCVKAARAKGWGAAVAVMPASFNDDVRGVNNRAEMAEVEALLQNRLRREAMLNGVTMIDPSSVTLACDTRFETDVVLEPHVFFGPGVEVGQGTRIRSFSHLEMVKIGENAVIGPFARLRPGAVIGDAAHIGNFVEIKNATVMTGAKVNHLTYIGDAEIGAKTNIGAGTITCNYDGFRKTKTIIGAGAFIGSNSTLVAPVVIGDGAFIAAGSVVTTDVPADSLAVARERQRNLPSWARRFREKNGGR